MNDSQRSFWCRLWLKTIDCEDGGKTIVKEMLLYEVDSILLNLLKEWIQERLKRGKECLQRAKETEVCFLICFYQIQATPLSCKENLQEKFLKKDEFKGKIRKIKHNDENCFLKKN